MNGTLEITKTYHERVGSHIWWGYVEFDNGVKPLTLGKYGGEGYEQSTVKVIEERLGGILIYLTDRGENVANLTVKLPEGVTLSAAYKTQVTTRFTADGTIGAITFA
ncbi:hypothetical protein [Paenibacillus sp. VMFN-D1]|uniref:hypothetical protein n=1 Tax=Paenibacillus sp. VMFN-D1 TaxID=2135608 RepID=UPI000E238DCB|nr:hypothetical protein [Paenibacillus sp. VMFN-D1]RED32424.1 hypothetical protein C7820_5704 [Paenibacillus sp. VMFN-D1]